VADKATLESWSRSIGLQVRGGDQDGELVVASLDGGPSTLLRRAGNEGWELVHDRRTTAAALKQAWLAPTDDASPLEVVAALVKRIASTYPLVDAELATSGENVRLRFSAPIYDEGLSKQTFLLTLSSFRKAVEAYDTAAAARADDLTALAEFQAQADAVVRRQQEELSHAAAVQSTNGPTG